MIKENASAYTDTLITDFSSPAFQTAFRRYFQELGITVRDWDGLWREMNGQGDNAAFLRTGPEGAAVGFIQFRPTLFTSWFFQETCGFIREFWVTPEERGMGHGAALLALAESWFLRNGIHTAILTTDTAAGFYLRRGYIPAPGCQAKNHDDVFVKHLPGT